MSFRDAIFAALDDAPGDNARDFHPVRDLIDNVRDNIRARREERQQARYERALASQNTHHRHNKDQDHVNLSQTDLNNEKQPSRQEEHSNIHLVSHQSDRNNQETKTQAKNTGFNGDQFASSVPAPYGDPPGFQNPDRQDAPKEIETKEISDSGDDYPERLFPDTILVKEKNGAEMEIAQEAGNNTDERLDAYLKERGSELHELDLNGSGISDQGLSFLNKAPNLAKLLLNDTEVNDESMKVLGKQGLKNLTELNLHSTRVGDDGIAALKGMNFKTLNLADTIIGDDAMKDIKGMKSLQVLTLDYSGVGNEGVKHLKDMPNLRSLSMKGCPITDDSISDLAKAQQLMLLNLEDTHLSADKVQWLQRNMPRTVIVAPENNGPTHGREDEGRKHKHNPFRFLRPFQRG